MFKAALLVGASMAAVSATGASAVTFGLTGQEVHYTVTTSGLYDLVAAGGNGGSISYVNQSQCGVTVTCTGPVLPDGVTREADGLYGGKGALLEALVSLDAGSVLDIFVGGHGGNQGGGGGGTFVFLEPTSGPALTADNALLVAGGGGGSEAGSYDNYVPGSGYGGNATAFGGNGNGGAGGSSFGGSGGFGGAGGGGGVVSSGVDGTANGSTTTYAGVKGVGGRSPAEGGQGGTFGNGNSQAANAFDGGFGGGGGAASGNNSLGSSYGGGGGGFTGGDAGGSTGGYAFEPSTAGTSYLRDGGQLVAATLNTGQNADGLFSIVLRQADPAAVPEPSTWATMLMGTGFVGWMLRRRRRVATTA